MGDPNYYRYTRLLCALNLNIHVVSPRGADRIGLQNQLS